MFREKPTIKTEQDFEIMRVGGKILAQIIEELSKEVVEGSSSYEVDKYANFLCKRYRVKPAFLGYRGFKGTICANLNEVVVHGVPNKLKFRKGDIFGLDMGIVFGGLVLDSSTTVEVGDVSADVKSFLEKTHLSMMRGIEQARPGNKVGDITDAMNRGLTSSTFTLMEDFIGHGIGRRMHETPDIPGIGGGPDREIEILPGMAFAIEAITVMGPTNAYEIAPDGWTVYTKEKRYLSGLFEHTVLVTKNGPEIVTKI